MKQTKRTVPTISSIYRSIENWCDRPGRSKKQSVRYFFAWTTVVLSALLIIFIASTLIVHQPKIAITIGLVLVAPITLFYLIRGIRWTFSND